jgi:tRNA A-37 threonylcarbamoyl transferase component Bud32
MTTLAVDDHLLNEAVQLGHHKSTQEAVVKALEHYIQDLKQQEILELFGTVEFDPDYDYKQQRNRL